MKSALAQITTVLGDFVHQTTLSQKRTLYYGLRFTECFKTLHTSLPNLGCKWAQNDSRQGLDLFNFFMRPIIDP